MNNVKIANSENFLDFLKSINYGINLLSFQDDQTYELALASVDVINAILGVEMIKIDTAFLDGIGNYGEFERKPIEGVYNMLWMSRNDSVPEITEDDLFLKSYAEKAFEFQKCETFVIHPNLIKYARKLAVKNNVKFINVEGKCYFDGTAKKKSLYKRIQEGFHSGVAKMEFEATEFSRPTIQVYASQLSAFSPDKKIRVSVVDGKIVVYFGVSAKHEIALMEVEKLFKKWQTEIGNEAICGVFSDFIHKYIPEDDMIVPRVNESAVTPHSKETLTDNHEDVYIPGIFSSTQTNQNQMMTSEPADEETLEIHPDESEPVPLVLDEKSKQFFIPGTEPNPSPDFDEDEEEF